MENAGPDLVEDVLARVPVPFETLAVFLSAADGSPPVNGDGDAIVSVVCRALPDLLPDDWIDVSVDPPHVPVVRRALRGGSCNVQYWLDRQVDAIFEKLRAAGGDAEPGPASERQVRLDYSEVELLDRLRAGTRVVGAEWLEDRWNVVAGGDLARFVAQRALDAADTVLGEAVLRLRTGDLRTSALAARTGFGLVVDALLAAAGECSPRTEWRPRRFERARLEALDRREYWDVETFRGYSEESARDWIEQTVDRARELSLEVDLGEG